MVGVVELELLVVVVVVVVLVVGVVLLVVVVGVVVEVVVVVVPWKLPTTIVTVDPFVREVPTDGFWEMTMPALA